MKGQTLAERLFMETDLYLELQSVLEDERSAIIDRDYQRLHELLARKDSLITRIAELASKRGRTGAAEDARKSRDAEERRAVAMASDALGGAMRAVRTLNTRNRLLIRASLQSVNSTLDLIESFCTAGTYSHAGHLRAKSLKGVSLNKGV